ncbi:Basic leucine zipper 34-like protein [Drosera capensis]
MAQLPPRAPPPSTVPHDHLNHHWLEHFHHHHQPNGSSLALALDSQDTPSWVDEFVEFTAARRGGRRRSTGDTVAFVEMPPVVDEFTGVVDGNGSIEAGSGGGRRHGDNEFERLDDEQLMSMFSNDQVVNGAGTTGNSSSPEQRSANENRTALCYQQAVKEEELEEEKQSISLFMMDEEQMQQEVAVGSNDPKAEATTGTVVAPNEQIQDPKRVKRILANRQSAQRSRVRKLQYISDLERNVTSLQAEVSLLAPRVAFLDHQRMLLNVDNSALKAKIAALAQDKIFKDAYQEALKREIERLTQVYYQQSLNNADNSVTPTSTPSPPSASAQPPAGDVKLNEEQLNI